MATRIRTLNFLPEIFQTPTNQQFLSATLDQLVQQPEVKKIEGYIGSKLGYGINAKNYYVTEPTKVRTDYQLDPGVVFTKTNEKTAKDFISYPGILDALKLEGAEISNNSRLFESQFYSWDNFTNLDKVINYNQYYWLPAGPAAVTVATATVFSNQDYIVGDLTNGYTLTPVEESASNVVNPTITLLRGGTYNFIVDQNSEFWIQGEPGVTGFSQTQPNLQTREIFGVTNNGANLGVVTFNVPAKNAQSQYEFPGNNLVSLVSNDPYSEINGKPVNSVSIDGITSLEGLTVMFYNTGQPNEIGYVSNFFDYTPFDENNNLTNLQTISITATNAVTDVITCNSTANLIVGNAIIFDGLPFGGLASYSPTLPNTIYFVEAIINSTEFRVSLSPGGPFVPLSTATGSMTGIINQGQFEQGYSTTVNENFYTITYIGAPGSQVIRLVPSSLIPVNEKITALYGTQWINRNFYRDSFGVINLIPYISAPLDTLYYQDGTSSNKVGTIKIINTNLTNTIDVTTDILGQKQYTATNGVVFSNGLKVKFQGDVIPVSYLTGEYYVEGVGESIELLPVENFIVPESFTASTFNPWDILGWDSTAWEGNSYIPVTPDYITIARNSIDKNAWSRSNRWFHIDVITATANYNNNQQLITLYTDPNYKAKRPIIEFYANLKLFESGIEGKNPVDYIDTRTTDAFSLVAGQQNYYPDIEVYTNYSATIAGRNNTATRYIQSGSNVTGIFTTDTGYDTTGFVLNDVINFTSITPGSGITPGVNYYVAEITSSTQFKISATKNGSVLIPSIAISSVYEFTWSPQSTTITINNTDVLRGVFTVGQYITDSTNIIPTNAQISEISGTTTLTLTIEWNATNNYFTTQTNSSIVTSDTTVDNYALFDGAKIIFSADENNNVKNKIFVSRLSIVNGSPTPIITLTESDDGDVLPNQQTVSLRGYYNQGKEFYFNGIEWIEGQQKITVNQPPLFDVYDKNNISFGDSSIYTGTSFNGCKLFAYGIGSGIDDTILNFPIRYSSVENVGDISFDVSLNLDTFDYVINNNPITQKVNTGYVYKFSSLTDYNRLLGWQTTISPSLQYQVFQFNYDPLNPITKFTCDIAKVDNSYTNWPTIIVYNNNQLIENYSVTVGTNYTEIVLSEQPLVNTVIQILIVSTQTSKTSFYTIPINLSNNPFNDDIETTNLGDIRGHYQSMFYNNPDSQGEVFGKNNFRDLGNMIPYGNKIIQNSASLVLPGTFLRKTEHNLFDALLFNSREYIKFKNLLMFTIQNNDYNQRFSAAQMLDDALDQITATKSNEQPFFWSDMLPGKAPYKSNTYSFANTLDVSIYPLDRVYDFTQANYYGVLVYLTRIINNITTTQQLVKDIDYIVSNDSPSLTVTLDLLPNDKITVNEYNQTYGSYVPNTPTKLGLYESCIPQVVLDKNYNEPTYFIKGHDGSYTKLYGDYNPTTGILTDFRDQVLLEFELRIHNNLKLSSSIPITQYEIVPGYFRTTDYSYDEWLNMYSTRFLSWVGENRLNYKTQLYNSSNPYSYNYYETGNQLNGEVIEQGYWRGIYQYFYDTTTPNTTPWEMLGFCNKPTWWENRYGPAPYTSDNLVLWTDIAEGINWNNGDPYVIESQVRPGLLDVIPVDSNGNLLEPLECIVGNYNQRLFKRDWKVGDNSPVEFSYRRSSTYPFDLIRLVALMNPAKFYNLAVDLDNYKYNEEFNQYLVNDRMHLKINDIKIYGNGTPKTSYINWIVDFEKQVGIPATENIEVLFNNLDVRLVYRLAGFSDKNLLKFYIEKGSPNNINSSLLIPDENYKVLLYDNQPFDRITYSGIIVQITEDGNYSVYGNSQVNAYFKTLKPKYSGQYETISIENVSVKITNEHFNEIQIIPYGYKFYSIQEISQFLIDYGAYFTEQGVQFTQQENELTLNWNQMVAEFIYWSQTGFEPGSIVTLNPCAKKLIIDKESYIVQPLTIQQINFILNQNLYPIQLKDLNIVRNGVEFNVNALNDGDTIAYAQFNISNFEHGIVFDNITQFNDVIYNLISGLRQTRITLRGNKSAVWDGTVNASGFIYNQDNIQEWNQNVKYTKGEIVNYKNKYWVALKLIQPNPIFNEIEWKITDYDEIQKGLLPNPSTRSYESTLYYDVYRTNLENDADLLGFSLIGYRPRDYLTLADLTDITQINVYKNMIKNKGTSNSVTAFKGANLPQGGIDYEVYENWEIKAGEFGGILNNNFVGFKLNEKYLTGNPAIVTLTNGEYIVGTQQEVPIYSLYNYARPILEPNILSTIDNNEPNILYPDAGYVNYNDVKMSAYFYSQMPVAVNKSNLIVPINEFYVRDYAWIANFKERWEVFSPVSLGKIIFAQNNLNGTVTIVFEQQHNLVQYQPFVIINFDININDYYLAVIIVDANTVIINKELDQTIKSITGEGIGLKLDSHRVSTPANILDLPLLNNEFTKNTVWVDTDSTGSWGVYRKQINYKNQNQFTKNSSQYFGGAVKIINDNDYLISDPDLGNVYRYLYNNLTQTFEIEQTINSAGNFGLDIDSAGDIYGIISNTDDRIKIYQLQNTQTSDDLVEIQDIIVAEPQNLRFSGDQKWLFVGVPAQDYVKIYKQENIITTAGYFIPNKTYVITSIGSTNFTSIGATSNIIGTKFKATGVGTGTGTATQITYNYVSDINGITLGLVTSGDNFGKSISTDYYGDCVYIGAPNKNYNSLDNWGYSYIFDRATQNIEIQYNNLYPSVQTLPLAWTPTTVQKTVISTTAPSTVTLNNTSGLTVNDPIIFTTVGTGLSGTQIMSDNVYYINSIVGNTITLKESRDTVTVFTVATNASVTATLHAQTESIFVYKNGSLVSDNNYAVVNNNLIYTKPLNAGDIITVSGRLITFVQSITTNESPQIGSQFGISLDASNDGSELLVGAPFQLNSQIEEGAVYRFTDGGAKYGIIYGTNECNVTVASKLLINGFIVYLPIGNASTIAETIVASKLNNITASAIDNKLIISLVNFDLSTSTDKLILSVVDSNVLNELGIEIYTQTQKILCPHKYGPTQFGSKVKFNELNSFIASAPVGTRYLNTTFDFIDDENQDNDTIFDNNSTQWIDQTPNFGAVYMFDYLNQYNESLYNVGKFIYAQSINSLNLVYSPFNSYNQETDITYNNQPLYGTAIDFNKHGAIVGTPNDTGSTTGFTYAGSVTTFKNESQIKDWSLFRQSTPVVDINKIFNIQLFSAENNNTLINLDYIDPLQGKILGAARENIDVVSNTDPASYNNDLRLPGNIVWGATQVGTLWLNTTNMRYVNYHQNNDVAYNAEYWGTLFPGSDVAVYSWILSNVVPANYQGPGTPLDLDKYSVQFVINASGALVANYYYWVRNTNIIFTENNKTLADSVIETYISNPQASGIGYFAPLLQKSFALYNCNEYFRANDTVLNIGFATGTNDDIQHQAYNLIRAGYPDDFLPGVPLFAGQTPESLYDRMLDSLCGVDEAGAVVPNPYLPKAVQSGILARPRQSFFYNRYNALKNYIQFVNNILLQYPITEIRQNLTFLNTKNSEIYETIVAGNCQAGTTYTIVTVGEVDWVSIGASSNAVGIVFTATGPAIGEYRNTGTASFLAFEESQKYDTQNYWTYVNWWAEGYNNNTKSNFQVQKYADLSTLVVNPGTIVRVENNDQLKAEIYILNNDYNWTRIGLERGTIELSSSLYNYETVRIGFGDNFYDTSPYDNYPSEETRNIIRCVNEQIFTEDLLINRNLSLILLFEYIQSEAHENQNYLPWLNKTSFIDVSHKIRELRPIEVFQNDNQDFLAGYINEVKPYHVVIKEFLFKYTGSEFFAGNVTDFDLPAKYNNSVNQFITPELVYADPSGVNQFLPTNSIWEEPEYKEWFNNYGLTVGYPETSAGTTLYIGEKNYLITTLSTYIGLNTQEFAVDNAQGLPTNGTLLIGSEKIGYSTVDRNLSIISGITRGVDGTTVSTHIPGQNIYIDLPAIIVLNGGKYYTETPKVSAVVDTTLYPEPNSPAILNAVMAGNTVISIEVLDPGSGYFSIPEIKIDPAITINFSSSDVSTLFNAVTVFTTLLETGMLIQYKVDAGSTSVGGLKNDQWYYIGVLETQPFTIIGFYNNYADAINNHDRLVLSSTGSGSGHTINIGARASTVTSATPVRENNITLKFDRIAYTSHLIDWRAGLYYGAFYAGDYLSRETLSSSSITLQSTQPPIESILASAQGVTFEITDVENRRTITYSSFVRLVESTLSVNNSIKLTLQDDGSGNPNASGGTLGFYIGMPIKFIGDIGGSGLVNNQVYYVNSILDLENFTVSINSTGTPILSLTTYNVGPAGLQCFVGEVYDIGVLTVNYSGILSIYSTESVTNKITTLLNPSGTGGTAGFYIGLPIFFTGTKPTSANNGVFGGIIENQPYYVTAVCDDETFTISENPNPQTFNVTSTVAANDTVVIDGDTTRLSLNQPLIFNTMVIAGVNVNNFGGLIAGEVYYVATIESPLTFTVSTAINGPIVSLTNVVAASNTSCLLISQSETLSLTTDNISANTTYGMVVNVNLPVSPGQVNGQKFTLYETSEQYPNITGSNESLIYRYISALIGNKFTYNANQLTEDIEYEILSVGTTNFIALGAASNSVGVRFIANASGTGTGTGTVTQVVNQIVLNNFVEGSTVALLLTNLYNNMPLEISTTLGSAFLTASTTYYIVNKGIITVDVTSTSATGNKITCNNTGSLFADMPILFSGTGMGGVEIDVEYWVKEVINSTQFTITNSPGGLVLTLTNDAGSMTGTGLPYIQVSTSLSGTSLDPGDTQQSASISAANPAVVTVAEAPVDGTTVIFRNGTVPSGMALNTTYYVRNATPTTFNLSTTPLGTLINTSTGSPGTSTMVITEAVQIDQTPLVLPEFSVSYILGGYRTVITNPGLGYAVTNTIKILGTLIGGTTPLNDLTITVNSISSTGQILQVICDGTTPGTQNQYYLKVISSNQFEIYSNPLMTVPVSGLSLPYIGTQYTNVTNINSTTEELTLVDASIFIVNDNVVFTGDLSLTSGAITLGQTYYITSISGNNITISNEPSGSNINFTSTVSVDFTIGKSGSYALLPEPFIFNQSIVKYNNRVWICIISNNDTEFVFGKWEELSSGDRRLNAMDRVYGYYAPTDNMPGIDLTQLFTGITYPNSTYLGNAFAPDNQYTLDTILQDQVFYPTEVELTSVTWNGQSYFAPANLPTYSSITLSADATSWDLKKIANSPISLRDILYANGVFIITSNNQATPIFRSSDGITWTTNGYYTPYGSTPYDETNYDLTALEVASLSLNAVTYYNGLYVAVGENIVSSDDTYIWRNRYEFTNGLTNEFFDVDGMAISSFNGFVVVGKGQILDYSSGIGTARNVGLVATSTSGLGYSLTPEFTTVGLYGITNNGSILCVVGENGAIYISSNGNTFNGINRSLVTSTNNVIDIINVSSALGLLTDDVIKFTDNFDVIVAGATYYVAQIVNSTQIRVSTSITNVSAPSIVNGNVYLIQSLGSTDWNVVAGTVAVTYSVGDVITAVSAGTGTGTARQLVNIIGSSSVPYLTEFYLSPTTNNLNNVYYANSVFVAVGDNGLIKTSTNAISWTVRNSNTTNNLNAVYYNSTDSEWVIVGDNNLVLKSIDNGITWTSTSLFVQESTIYDVQGADFTFGYGPEELVPGVVTDNLSMIVATRPGTNWDETLYQHVGYNIISFEFEPTSGTQTNYSFNNNEFGTKTIMQIAVYIINGTTNLCTAIYSGIDYTVDWVNLQVVLNTPLAFIPVKDKLRIDIYETGNGSQLVKANTFTDPIRLNNITGWNEIYVNCNYTGEIYQGSGVVKPNTSPKDAVATKTSSTGNLITFDSVKDFVLDNPITFQGTTFGGIVEDTIYYVKTISYATNSITISDSFNIGTGTAGPTFNLTDATGYMFAVIKVGNGEVWTAPLVYHNGNELLLGKISTVTRTKSSNNGVVCNSTSNFVVGEKVTFSDTMFGSDLSPQTVYYIKTIIDDNEFTVSATLGGPVLVLSDATGGAKCITNDYAFELQPNGISAAIVFAVGTYDASVDYITYTLFGETSPVQYGYTLPETQLLASDGTVGPYTLLNYIGDDNPDNAVVEVNGLRQSNTDYTIDSNLNTLTFTIAPTLGDTIAVTSYNNTDRQYFNTQYGITGITVAKILSISNTITPYLAETNVTATTTGTNRITCGSTSGFVVNQTIQFKGTGFGGLNSPAGTVYFIDSIVSSTEFTISDTLGGSTKSLTTAVGLLQAFIGGQPAVRVETGINHNLTTNDLVKIDGTGGSTQLNNNNYYVHVISSTIVDLYLNTYDPAVGAVNDPVTAVSAYTSGSGGYIWISNSYIIITADVTNTTSSPILGNYLTTASTSMLVQNTPIIFTGTVFGGVSANTTYYIKEIISVTEFSISNTRYGDEVILSTAAGTMQITQWEQENVDRLWVTVNGYRVPSSSLRLNSNNEVSILSQILSTDEVIITSMMPSATPNEEIFLLNVNANNIGTVYRANTLTRTWLTQPLYNTDETIYVYDVSRLTDVKTQTSIAPAPVNNVYSIGIIGDKNIISNISIYNNTKSIAISSTYFEIVIENLAPILKITAGSYISTSDNLTITILEGNLIYINGEQIKFTSIDVTNNTITGIQRGSNGTRVTEFIDKNTEVYGILSNNLLSNPDYSETWNSNIYNTVDGDPLQISETQSAIFLRGDLT